VAKDNSKFAGRKHHWESIPGNIEVWLEHLARDQTHFHHQAYFFQIHRGGWNLQEITQIFDPKWKQVVQFVRVTRVNMCSTFQQQGPIAQQESKDESSIASIKTVTKIRADINSPIFLWLEIELV
jgi:hypothetical protein